LVEAVRSGDSRDVDEQIWLTRFLVVRACGYLEQVVQEVVTGYINERAGGTLKSFSLSWMNKSRNPSRDNLLDIAGRFDAGWHDDLQAMLEANDEYLKRELSALVSRRHQIAHGLDEGLTSRKAIELVLVSKQLADWFIRQFNPDVAKHRLKRTSAI
jgi:hypothetical protein